MGCNSFSSTVIGAKKRLASATLQSNDGKHYQVNAINSCNISELKETALLPVGHSEVNNAHGAVPSNGIKSAKG